MQSALQKDDGNYRKIQYGSFLESFELEDLVRLNLLYRILLSAVS